MTGGFFSLTVFSAALCCLGTLGIGSLEAAPQKPWYVVAFNRIFRVVNENGQPEAVAAKPVLQAEEVYVSRLTKEDGAITLKGQVPSEADLKLLQGIAAATSPGSTLVDRSRLSPGVLDHDAWLAAMTFALRQLGKLEYGSALLRNTVISIEGVTKAGDDFAVVQKKLRDEAPKGLVLQVALKPHEVHPFTWVAQLQPGMLNLTGHVPDQQDEIICGYAQNLFQNLKVNNRMEFAKGEPRGWLPASKLALDMLSLLYTGNVAINENVIRVDGIYSSPAMVDVFKLYSKRLPKGFVLETNILEPVARAPAARAEDASFAAHTASALMNP